MKRYILQYVHFEPEIMMDVTSRNRNEWGVHQHIIEGKGKKDIQYRCTATFLYEQGL